MPKKLFFTLSGAVLLSLFLAGNWPGNSKGAEEIYSGQLLRFHVVAQSDSVQDQYLKRKVRDEIVQQVAPEFARAENISKAREIARANLKLIEEIAAGVIRKEGKDYPVRAELATFAFPTKHYGPFLLPAGDYEAVRVVIGGGGGSNWWCVLFPPLCFIDLTREAALTPGENDCLPPAEPTRTFTQPVEQPLTGFNSLPTPAAARESRKTEEDPGFRVEFRFKVLDLWKKYLG